MKASDISDRAVLSAIRVIQNRLNTTGPVSIWDVQDYLGKWPKKVVRAKLQSMERRKLITGCFHFGTPCRGDIRIVQS